MQHPNDPALKSWVPVRTDSDFPIQNLPFGIFKTDKSPARAGVAIGDHVVDLYSLHVLGYLENLPFKQEDLQSASLNRLMAHGRTHISRLRDRLSKLLRSDFPDLKNKEHHVAQVLVPMADVQMLLPVDIGDYTDFYASEQHAFNVGTMFRGPENALMPNWKHMPIGYHGRASSIVISGTPLHRPKGQMRPDPEQPPVFGPTKQLDFELEVGFVTYSGKPLGQSITAAEADEYIFGMVLFNDWSARDIQAWEYVPLGPFLGKNFGSAVSPWIVTMDALEPYRTAGPVQEPAVLPYLQSPAARHLDIELEVLIKTPDGTENSVSRSNMRHLYWNMNQMLAHHTINGCNVRCGDLMASGTISAPQETGFGSMLELSWRGTKPLRMADGTERKFIQDNDTVIMRGYGKRNGVRVGFGEVISKVLPAV